MDDGRYARMLTEDLISDLPLDDQLATLAEFIDGAADRRDRLGAKRSVELACKLRSTKPIAA